MKVILTALMLATSLTPVLSEARPAQTAGSPAAVSDDLPECGPDSAAPAAGHTIRHAKPKAKIVHRHTAPATAKPVAAAPKKALPTAKPAAASHAGAKPKAHVWHKPKIVHHIAGVPTAPAAAAVRRVGKGFCVIHKQKVEDLAPAPAATAPIEGPVGGPVGIGKTSGSGADTAPHAALGHVATGSAASAAAPAAVGAAATATVVGAGTAATSLAIPMVAGATAATVGVVAAAKPKSH